MEQELVLDKYQHVNDDRGRYITIFTLPVFADNLHLSEYIALDQLRSTINSLINMSSSAFRCVQVFYSRAASAK